MACHSTGYDKRNTHARNHKHPGTLKEGKTKDNINYKDARRRIKQGKTCAVKGVGPSVPH